MKPSLALVSFILCATNPLLRAEDGHAAWLRYAPISDPNVREAYGRLPAATVVLDSSLLVKTAQKELIRGVRGMLGRTLRIDAQWPNEDCLLLGTLESVRRAALDMQLPERLDDDAYLLRTTAAHGHKILLITGGNDRAVLYGAFSLLRKIALQQDLEHVDEQSAPYAPIRWTNEWDNLDGSIERGYAGRSIFFRIARALSCTNQS
jgi:alpha-glucuronidase